MKRYDMVKAVKTLRELMANPDDLPKVFTLIDALQGTAAPRLKKGFLAREDGRWLFEHRPDIVPLLSDRKALRKMPAGSLAHAYLAFVESENISAEGIVDAATRGREIRDDGYQWQRDRMRDTHDLWHAVTGYQGDVLGELSLLAFLLAQHWQPGIALVLMGGLSKLVQPEARWLIAEGFVRGKRADWLPSQRWEELLPLEVNEVRRRLRVGGAPVYAPVRTAELRERALIPELKHAA